MMKAQKLQLSKGQLQPHTAVPCSFTRFHQPSLGCKQLAGCQRLRVNPSQWQLQAAAAVQESVSSEQVPTKADTVLWFNRDCAPNMRDVNSIQELVDVLSDADDRLVIVEFFAPWCNACKALYPKICKLMAEHPEVTFVKVNYDLNKPMCKTMNVKALPLFHFYHGAEGRVESFTCSVTKIAKFKAAMDAWNTPICSLEPLPELPEFPDVHAHVDVAHHQEAHHPVYEHEGYDWEQNEDGLLPGSDVITILPPYALDGTGIMDNSTADARPLSLNGAAL